MMVSQLPLLLFIVLLSMGTMQGFRVMAGRRPVHQAAPFSFLSMANEGKVTGNEHTMSLIKEGIKFPSNLDGSAIRVGVIMARWNADVIQGLQAVSTTSLMVLY